MKALNTVFAAVRMDRRIHAMTPDGFVSPNAANGWAWNTVWKLAGAPIPDPAATGGR